MLVVCYYMTHPIRPKQLEKCDPEDGGSGSGIREGWDPPSQDDRIFRYQEEDTRYLIVVHKNTLQRHRSKERPLLSERGRRLKGSVKTKSDCSWTIRDFPVPEL